MSRNRNSRLTAFAACAVVALCMGSATAPAHPIGSNVPLVFFENPGHLDPTIQFAGRSGALTTLFLTDGFAVRAAQGRGEELRGTQLVYTFEGAAPSARIDAIEPLDGRVNFLLGRDPSAWRTDLATYAALRYSGVYAGIDIVFRENGGVLEYDLMLSPGADLSQVRMRCEGADALHVDAQGNLVAETAVGTFIQSRPVTIERSDNGVAREVACHFVLLDEGAFGFAAPDRDPSARLLVDPGITFCGFLGGSNDDHDCGLAIGNDCACHVTGDTLSLDFPITAGAFDATANGQNDVFITKIVGIGNAILYSTYVGGSANDYGHGIVVDADGNSFVAGGTESANFPVSAGAFSTTLKGFTDMFVVKLASDGSAIAWASYLGGSGVEGTLGGQAISLRGDGRACVTGYTSSLDFPVTKGAPDTTQNDAGQFTDALVSEFTADGSALTFSTYLGGQDQDVGNSIAISPTGSVVVGGWSLSPDFPVTVGAFATTPAGLNGFVTDLDPTKVTPVAFTSFSGGGEQVVRDVAVANDGSVFLAGYVTKASALTTAGAFDTTYNGGVADGFILKVTSDGAAVIYGSYFGGSGDDGINAIDTDGATDDVYFAGSTTSADLATTAGAFDSSYNGGGSDAFVARLSASGSTLVYSSYLGGSSQEAAYAINAHQENSVYVAGGTSSIDFPATNSFDNTHNGSEDAFVMLLPVGAQACPDAAAVATYGNGKAGVNGVPQLNAVGLPTVPSATFALNVSNAAVNAPAWIVLGLQAGSTPLDGGTLLVAPILIEFTMTNGAGQIDIQTPIAENPNYCGVNLFAQVLVQDAAVATPLKLAMTPGLMLTFGN